jgi:predicted RNA-binding protein
MLYGYCFNENDPEYCLIKTNDGVLTRDVLEEKYTRVDNIFVIKLNDHEVYVGVDIEHNTLFENIKQALGEFIDKLEDYGVFIDREPRFFTHWDSDYDDILYCLYLPKLDNQ